MSHSSPQNNFYVSEPFQDFLCWLKANCKSTGHPEDALFLPRDLLSAHLESNECEVLNTLLGAIYQDHAVPISAKEVVGAYSRVFCILVRIGKIESLPTFMRCDNLNDAHLPFNLHERPRFPDDPTTPNFFEDFYNEQWTFCPPTIDPNLNRRLEKDYVLPFTTKVQIAEGASATISTIEIYPLYNALYELPNATNKSATIYALKTYRGRDAKTSWTKEVQAFQKLRGRGSSTNVIGFYTAFKHGDTYHAIIEYADQGSMEKYFKSNIPPKDGIDVARLWKQVLGLIRGLKDLHNGNEVIFHQDIKPANVLVLGDPHSSAPYASIFKIADLGTSHSKRLVPEDQDQSNPDAQGTRTYGAPECYRADSILGQGSIRVTKAVDIFSLGCILSEFAVWMSGGYDYLVQYRQARRKAIQQIPDFHDGDCFHNGLNMLPAVGEWHQKVQSKLIFTDDTLTPKLIPMIEEMLQHARDRGDATNFCTKAHTIFAEAHEAFRRQYPDRAIPDDILPRSLRLKSQRMEPPVRPFDADQEEKTTPLAIQPASFSNLAESTTVKSTRCVPISSQHEPFVRSQSTSTSGGQGTQRDGHTPTFEYGLRPSRHGHVTSAPIETPPSIFDIHSEEHRRYSEQPKLRQSRPGISRAAPHTLSVIDSGLPGIASSSSPQGSFHNSDYGVNMNGNIPRPNNMNHFQENNPYLPLMGVVTPTVRPSTSSPILFPTNPAANYSPPNPGNGRSIAAIMSRKEAMEWRDKKKAASRWNPDPALRDAWVLKFLEDRDSVIIIDDSKSMRLDHWEDMTQLLGIIVYMIKSFDKDGLDLYFAQSSVKHHSDNSSKLVGIVEKRKVCKDLGPTDMSVRLEQVLGEYAAKLKREGIPRRGLNVYIFTDAIWTPFCDIVPAIDNMVRTLVDLNAPEKQVGLQFISFGTDTEGLKRLKLVDNYLVLKPSHPHDIVDTTPSSGNLYKMIRGAIDRNFDYASEEA